MKLFGKTIIVAVLSLVTGTAILVYLVYALGPAPSAKAGDGARGSDMRPSLMAANEQAQPKNTEPLPSSDDTATATDSDDPQPQFDLSTLPKLVQENIAKTVAAAQTGDVEAIRPVLESNGLKPMVRNGPSTDPIAYWKKHSADGSGRDILASILNVFSSGYVKIERKDSVMYVWPYFAERDLKTLTPVEQVELFRIVPPKQAVKMMETGKYTGYRAGLSERGILHYFKK